MTRQTPPTPLRAARANIAHGLLRTTLRPPAIHTLEAAPRTAPRVGLSPARRGSPRADCVASELIADRVWRTGAQLELAIVEWVGWFNHDRLHESPWRPSPDRI